MNNNLNVNTVLPSPSSISHISSLASHDDETSTTYTSSQNTINPYDVPWDSSPSMQSSSVHSSFESPFFEANTNNNEEINLYTAYFNKNVLFEQPSFATLENFLGFNLYEIKQCIAKNQYAKLCELCKNLKTSKFIDQNFMNGLYWRCITFNSIPIFEYLLEFFSDYRPIEIQFLYDAITLNRKKIVKIMLSLDSIDIVTCSYTIKQRLLFIVIKSKEPIAYLKMLNKNNFDFSCNQNSLIENMAKFKSAARIIEFLIEDEYTYLNRKNKMNILHTACLYSNDQIIRYFLKNFPQSVKVDQYMLSMAIKNKNTKIFEFLIDRVKRSDSYLTSPNNYIFYQALYVAVEENCKQEVIILLESCKLNPLVILQEKRISAAILACRLNRECIVEYFVKKGYYDQRMITELCMNDSCNLFHFLFNEIKPQSRIFHYKKCIDICVKQKSFTILRHLFNQKTDYLSFQTLCIMHARKSKSLENKLISYTLEALLYYQNMFFAIYFWRYIILQKWPEKIKKTITTTTPEKTLATKPKAKNEPELHQDCIICLASLKSKEIRINKRGWGMNKESKVITEDYILCSTGCHGMHLICFLLHVIAKNTKKKEEELSDSIGCPLKCTESIPLTNFYMTSIGLNKELEFEDQEEITVDYYKLGLLYGDTDKDRFVEIVEGGNDDHLISPSSPEQAISNYNIIPETPSPLPSYHQYSDAENDEENIVESSDFDDENI